jgi:hypothetical protein
MMRLRNRPGLRGLCGVDVDGRSGGLALFWRESVVMDVKEKK